MPKEPDKNTQIFILSHSTPIIVLPVIHRLTLRPNPQIKAPELISHRAGESHSIQLNFHGNRPLRRYVRHRSYRNRYGLKMASTAISVTSITGRVRRTQAWITFSVCLKLSPMAKSTKQLSVTTSSRRQDFHSPY